MPESLKTKAMRHAFNWFPAYRGTGGRVTYIASDFREVRVEVPLNWRTRNYVGTTFGGSLYGAVDPVYMLMLMRCLGREFIVWDKAATLRFQRPGKGTLRASFLLSQEELTLIHELLTTQRSVDRFYTVELKGLDGTVHATVEKTVYIRRKDSVRH